MPYFNLVSSIGRWRFGFTHDLIYDADQPYLERWIIWCGFTLRLHKFHKGDDDRAFHDHPWWFITLPFNSYRELTPQADGKTHSRLVRRMRPHWRRAKHRHIVQMIDNQPVHTLIITGLKSKEWGFWDREKFVHHEHWLRNNEVADSATNT